MSDENKNPDELTKPSVQDVIDRLMQVEDKIQPFEIETWDEDGINLDYSAIEIHEYTHTNGTPSGVALEVKFTGEVTQTFGGSDEDVGRVIDYIGEKVTLTPYEEKHRPQNQQLVQGIPFNPVLRDDFDQTPNDDRENLEISDWWDQPFIRAYTWADMGDSYTAYLARVSGLENHTPMSREAFDREQEERRVKWFKAWPTGVRYDVRCLNGGAWDRSTSCAMVGSLEEAIEIARSGSSLRTKFG